MKGSMKVLCHNAGFKALMKYAENEFYVMRKLFPHSKNYL